jgi:serine/threonine-protein kinase
MASIWLARDERLDRPVAMKLLPNERAIPGIEKSYLTERLLREGRIISQVRHAAIVRAFDFGLDGSDEPYLVMELLMGESFERVLRPGRGMGPERSVQLLLPIADGLAAVHAAGAVHRDVKPDNLFLSWQPMGQTQPKLIDFGVAKVAAHPHARRLTSGGLIGTPEYMAPEQIIDASDVDARADVWSYAVVLYEVLSGRVPFLGRSYPEVLRAVLQSEALPLGTKGVDAALAAIVERGLRKDPAERWASMLEFRAALGQWLASRGAQEEFLPGQSQIRLVVPRDNGRS